MSAYRRAELAIEKYIVKKSLDSEIDFDYCLIGKIELTKRFDNHLATKNKRINKTFLWDDGDWEEPSTRIYIFLYEDGSEVLLTYEDDEKMKEILANFNDTFIIQADIEEHLF